MSFGDGLSYAISVGVDSSAFVDQAGVEENEKNGGDCDSIAMLKNGSCGGDYSDDLVA